MKSIGHVDVEFMVELAKERKGMMKRRGDKKWKFAIFVVNHQMGLG